MHSSKVHYDHVVVSPEYQSMQAELLDALAGFDEFGHVLQQARNTIRHGEVGGLELTIKSYKKPGVVQGLVYRLFRPSKAKRAYLYAHTLLKKGIGTALPVAYVENYSKGRLAESFFVSLYIDHDFTIRDVIDNKIADKDRIYDEFVAFTLSLHQKGVLHLDHSPGNTLIKKNGDTYEFSIIDINRMKFLNVDMAARLENLVRITNSSRELSDITRRYAVQSSQDAGACWTQVERLLEKRLKRAQRKTLLKNILGIKKHA